MKKVANIHNLKSLEKEIHRLKQEAKYTEKKLDNNFEYLRENYFSLFVNSFFQGEEKENDNEEETSFFSAFTKNESFDEAINKLTDHIAEKAAEGINNLVDRFFPEKE